MTPIRGKLRLGIAFLGLAPLAASIAWWALSYWQVWQNAYLSLPQVSHCLVAETPLCRLASALCTGQHRPFTGQYSPVLFWLSTLLLCGTGPLAWRWPPARQRR